TPAIRAYDVIARRLVAAGWSGSQPIAVFGDPYAYRTPLEWYLPHQPSLTFASPRAASCANVFLVRPGGLVVPTTLGAAPTTSHPTLLRSENADRRCLHKSKPGCAPPAGPRTEPNRLPGRVVAVLRTKVTWRRRRCSGTPPCRNERDHPC